MVEILTPLSLWVQLASFCFAVSGVLADLLVIRLFLFFAYIFLFLNSVLGSPLWPDIYNADVLTLDGLVWSSIGLYVHGDSLIRLLLDERKVTFSSAEESALSRMFYRTSGLSERLFKVIISPQLELVDFEAGQEIPVNDHFYIVYSGKVMLNVYANGEFRSKRIIPSSQAFDINDLNLFTTSAGKTIFDKHSIQCTSMTATRLFRFSRQEMKKVAQHQPFSKGIWQALLINNLSFVVESYATTGTTSMTTIPDSYQQQQQPKENNVTDDGSLALDKIFEPLQDYELPHPMEAGSGLALRSPLQHIFRYLTRSFSPPWPLGEKGQGIRQTLLAMPPRQKEPGTRRWTHMGDKSDDDGKNNGNR